MLFHQVLNKPIFLIVCHTCTIPYFLFLIHYLLALTFQSTNKWAVTSFNFSSSCKFDIRKGLVLNTKTIDEILRKASLGLILKVKFFQIFTAIGWQRRYSFQPRANF